MSRTFCVNTQVLISSQKPCWHFQRVIFTRQGVHTRGLTHLKDSWDDRVHDVKSVVLPLHSATAFWNVMWPDFFKSCDLLMQRPHPTPPPKKNPTVHCIFFPFSSISSCQVTMSVFVVFRKMWHLPGFKFLCQSTSEKMSKCSKRRLTCARLFRSF